MREKGKAVHPPPNPRACKDWETFCRETWNLSDDVVSDVFVVWSAIDDLRKANRNQISMKNIVSRSARRTLHKLGIISGIGSSFGVDLAIAQKYLDLIPLGKRAQ